MGKGYMKGGWEGRERVWWKVREALGGGVLFGEGEEFFAEKLFEGLLGGFVTGKVFELVEDIGVDADGDLGFERGLLA